MLDGNEIDLSIPIMNGFNHRKTVSVNKHPYCRFPNRYFYTGKQTELKIDTQDEKECENTLKNLRHEYLAKVLETINFHEHSKYLRFAEDTCLSIGVLKRYISISSAPSIDSDPS